MSGNRSIASAKNRRSMPERTNEISSKNDISDNRVPKKDIAPKKITKEERNVIIAEFQKGPLNLFTISRNQELRIQILEEQIELYNRAVFQDLNDRIKALTIECQKLKPHREDYTNIHTIIHSVDEVNEDSS